MKTKDFRIAAFRDAVWADSELSAHAKLVALSLACHWNADRRACWVSIPKLSRETSLGESTVKRALAELESSEYVQTLSRVRLERNNGNGNKLVPAEFSNTKTGRGWVAYRTLHLPESGSVRTPSTEKRGSGWTASPQASLQKGGQERGSERADTSLLPRREEVGAVALMRDDRAEARSGLALGDNLETIENDRGGLRGETASTAPHELSIENNEPGAGAKGEVDRWNAYEDLVKEGPVAYEDDVAELIAEAACERELATVAWQELVGPVATEAELRAEEDAAWARGDRDASREISLSLLLRNIGPMAALPPEELEPEDLEEARLEDYARTELARESELASSV